MERKQFILGIFLSLLVIAVSFAPAGAQPVQANEVVRLVNELRASKGLPAYHVDGTLTAIAQAQADWSAANNHFGHDGPGGNTPRERALVGGYGGGKTISAQENIASGTLPYITPEWVVTMWQGDDVHLGALLSTNHDDIGVGYAEANGYAWYVMMIGRVGTGNLAPTRRPQPTQETIADNGAPVEPIVPAQLSTPEPDGSIRHVVQVGQTAWTVAAYYGIELQALLAMNNLTEDAVLQPGDVLLIQPPSIAASVTPTRTESANTPIMTLAPTSIPSPTAPSEEKTADGPPMVIWGLLVAASVVLVGSGVRTAYILRQWKTAPRASGE
ncbi:MAG: LysM peptidoglycan-binding domain-containing protein [Anaerolineae bacterium]|nr:LysM peptidoglycan-binding domain-containing protein [Anaerolineae bacterium]